MSEDDHGQPAKRALAPSEPPAGSAVRPRGTLPGAGDPASGAPGAARSTAPGLGTPPSAPRSTAPGFGEPVQERLDPTALDPTALDRTLHDPTPPVSSGETELDSDELDYRVTLADLPALAQYGRYELLGRIAYGGMAEIFLAREIAGQGGAHRMMVVKRVLPHVAEDEHFVDMFVDEARLAMQLNHPGICHVYAFGEEQGSYYIAMEWVNGKPVSKIMRRAKELGGLPIPIALRIFAQVAEALDYAHRACDPAGEPLGVVHRDVSPQNIMVSYDGVVKLLDFGIAKASSHSTRTEAGVIKGKFAYMSPQQCVGEPIDGRADLFALGTCLFEALTGKNPFRRKTEFETMMRIVGDPIPTLKEVRPDVPDAVDALVQKALMREPERRFQTGAEMQQAIEEALAKQGLFVNANKLAEYMQGLFGDEIKQGPDLDMRLSMPPRPSGDRITSQDHSSERPRPIEPGATLLDAKPLDARPLAKEVRSRKKSSGLVLFLFAVLALFGLAAMGSAAALLLLTPRDPEAAASAPGVDPPQAVVPPSPPPPPIAQGSVLFESDPPGATVIFRGRELGRTPIEQGMVDPGTYSIEMRNDSGSWTGDVVIYPGAQAHVNARIVAAGVAAISEREVAAPRAAAGQLSLNTSPWSRVYLGSRLLGTTPLGRVSVPSGTQRLRLVDRDGNEHRVTVRVPAGGHAQEFFDLR